MKEVEKALELAHSLKPKGTGPARKALQGIKKNVYKSVLDVLNDRGVGGGTKGNVKGQYYVAPPKQDGVGKAKL